MDDTGKEDAHDEHEENTCARRRESRISRAHKLTEEKGFVRQLRTRTARTGQQGQGEMAGPPWGPRPPRWGAPAMSGKPSGGGSLAAADAAAATSACCCAQRGRVTGKSNWRVDAV